MGINGCALCLDKQRDIDRLKGEVKRLKDALRYKERAEKEGLFGSSTSSAKLPVKANVPDRADKKKRGARLGHPGAGRKAFDAEEADQVVQLPAPSFETCPHCGGQLEDAEEESREVLDCASLKAQRIFYHRPCKRCRRCRRRYKAHPPGVLPRALFGNQLLANAVVMHYLHGAPLERVGEQLGVKPPSLVAAMHRLSGLFAKVPDKLVELYRQAPVKHADETKWRYEGKNGYAWLFATPTISIFRFDKTRSATVPNSVFGDKRLPGVLVVDRYTGYNKVPCDIQYCYAHLLRDVQDLTKQFGDNQEVLSFVGTVAPLLSGAIKLRNNPLSDGEFLRQAAQLEASIRENMLASAQHEGILHMQRVFIKNEARLYHWAKDHRVPAENNLAERDLRPTVIARKTSFGSQSPAGAKTRSILMTVVRTLHKQGHDAAQRLKSTLDAIADDAGGDPYPLLFGTSSSSLPRAQPDPTATAPPVVATEPQPSQFAAT